MTLIRRHLGAPAMIVACVSLVVALGGVSYAAGVLPKNSVGTAQIQKKAVTGAKLKKNSVTGAKVKNGSLMAADFEAGQLPAGPQGAEGRQGREGRARRQGSARSRHGWPAERRHLAWEVGCRGGGRCGRQDRRVSELRVAALGVTDAALHSKRSSPPPECPGTVLNPQAAAGHLCVYEGSNKGNVETPSTVVFDANTGSGRYGFDFQVYAEYGGLYFTFGTWAVTGA